MRKDRMEVLKIKKIKPLFDNLVTTMNRYKDDYKIKGTDIIDSSKSGAVKEYQTVIAKGGFCKDINVGDTVFINPARYAVMKHEKGSLQDGIIKDNPVVGFNFETIEVDGKECLLLKHADIKFVAEVEEFETNPAIVTEKNTRKPIEL